MRCASLPLLGFFADHYWFVVTEQDRCHRWEVWQTQNAGGLSFGHVHCDLKGPEDGVGGGAARLVATWRGEEAQRIAAVLATPETYPHRGQYLPWPGPNSNTYVAWVLREAGIELELDWRAHGASYNG